MRYWLVMPAAGAGRRFGGGRPGGRQSGSSQSGAPQSEAGQSGQPIPKQYAALHGRTVIEWALAPFLADARCAGVVVALAAGDQWWPQVAMRIPAVTVCQGGAERSESVRNALAALNRRAGEDDWVLVHDAARPCLTRADLDRLIEQVGTHAVGGILAQPVADTLKRAEPAPSPAAAAGVKAAQSSAAGDASADAGQKASACAASIDQTIDRTGLWRAGTPQMFRYARLLDALERALAAGRQPTDEAQALEWLGEHPLLVEGSAANLKVTTASDLALAESLLAGRATKGE